MKKLALTLTLAIVFVLCISLSVFAEDGIFKLEKIGEYTKFATYHESFATPHSGTVFDNSTLEYPFINYLGYTYIPLTFHTTKSLGITSHWTREDGLCLTSFNKSELYSRGILGKGSMIKGKMYKASLYEGTITLNGKKYTSDDVYYPLLSFGNIVYIPTLWRQGMEDLGLTCSYDLDTKSVVVLNE